MRSTLTLLILLLALGGCDKEKRRLYHDDQSFERVGTAQCDLGIGYCMACGMGLNGRYDCAWGLKYSCPGEQPARYRITPYTSFKESGNSSLGQYEELIEAYGECT